MFKADVQIKKNFIGGRQGYAYTFNSGKIKTVKIDLGQYQEYRDCKKWRDVIKAHKQTSRFDIDKTCSIYHIFNDDGSDVWELSCAGAFLSNSFDFNDLMELANNANLPVVNEGDIVALFQFSDLAKAGCVQLFKVGKIDIHCSTVAKLIPLSDEEMKQIADDVQRWVNR